MRGEDERYFDRIESQLDEAFTVAEAAKGQGGDPKPQVEIPVAQDMADRVENILGIEGVAERVRELDGEMSREEAALALAEDFAEGRVGSSDSAGATIEGAVRTAVALLTEGVVAAPIEGIDRVEVLENDDGTEFVRVFYAGPIRSAGGTAQALSVLVADYARTLLGLDRYKPREQEIERYVQEIDLYDDETGLQYSPKEKETKFIAEHCPIMLDGEATGDEEVSGYRDLDRVDTNNARGGMCLVLAEGIAQKAPKIKRYTEQLDEVAWPWLDDLIEGTIGPQADDEETDTAEPESDEDRPDDEATDITEPESEGPPRVEPTSKFLRDLIAGRPVFSHPSREGGFRLRYGRARNHGFATAGIHPATMHIVSNFLATGTQIKTERPGKAAGVVPVDSIEGPTVRLANGDVRRIDDPEEARKLRNGVDAILDLGEYLVNYGEFIENNHPLAPASYTTEWWVQEFDHADGDVQALQDDPNVDLSEPTVEEALSWATAYDSPLHPKYTYLWHDLTIDEFVSLAKVVADGHWKVFDEEESILVVPCSPTDAQVDSQSGSESDSGSGFEFGGETTVETGSGFQFVADSESSGETESGVETESESIDVPSSLEALLIEHTQHEEHITIPDALAFVRSLGLTDDLEMQWSRGDLTEEARTWESGENAIKAVNEIAPFTVRERAPTRIGNRMGRPEKSEKRELSPAVHTLFPIGEAGGNQRNVSQAASHADSIDAAAGQIEMQIARRECTACDIETFVARCPDCNAVTEPVYVCRDCEIRADPDETGRAECPRCEALATPVEYRPVDVESEYRNALATLGERESAFDILKGVKGLTSAHKVPEPIEKGVLRAKHGVSVFKDGTIRYDMTDLPVTAVRPAELDSTADRFRELGYETDIDGEPLRFDDQLVELRVQDIVLSDGAAVHMLKTADFVDDLLEGYYGLEPFYGFEERDDLVGELVFGMAPHTSAAVVGRVVGFTSAAVGYAHPYFHAAKRRNCFHPDTKIAYEDEEGRYRYERIEDLVETRLDDSRKDDFGTRVTELDGEIQVPSLTSDGETVHRPITGVSKHRSSDHLVEIETNSGRTLQVTPDHTIQRCNEAEINRTNASDIKVGDKIPLPKSIDFDGSSSSYDLLEECISHDNIRNDEIMISGVGSEELEHLLDNATDSKYYLKPLADRLDCSQSTVYNWVSRDSIPASILLELYDISTLLTTLPSDISLSVKRDSVAVSRILEVDQQFASLLGYYTAEGYVREEKGKFYQTTICTPDDAPRNEITQTFINSLGVDAYEENKWKITVSSRIISFIFSKVIQAGTDAESKSIPECVMGGPDDHLQSFLAAYFSGDGSASQNCIEIRAHTISDDLKRDLIGALKRFGIVPKVYQETRTPNNGVVADFYDGVPPTFESWVLKITSENANRFYEQIGFDLERKENILSTSLDTIELRSQRLLEDSGEMWLDEVVAHRIIESDVDHTYCLTVEDTHTLVANDLFVGQCDGDEDCVMLLLDGLLNFSKLYLPDKRGGRMDAPLVMSSRIDPTEIDDEAHNVDIVERYPQEFYEATRRMADPGEVDITIAEETLETERQYTGFKHTHDTSDLAAGPDLSAYKTLGSMLDKMDAQLELARKLRAVDETDVAERVIEYHFLPDLIGNLRAFSRQETRCLDCNTKYRRMPLTGDCRECGGRVTLTVHEGSVNKYMDTAIHVAAEFDCREYTKQRLEILDKNLESVFENDKNKQSGIADFM